MLPSISVFRTVGTLSGTFATTTVRSVSSSSSAAVILPSFRPTLHRLSPSSSPFLSFPSSSSFVRTLFVKVYGPNASRDLERLQLKVDASGIERRLSSRKRFVKPHLVRQQNVKNAVYTKAKNERIKLVEEMMLDRSISGL